MKGQEIVSAFNDVGNNEAVHLFTSHFVAESNTETTAVGCYLILVDNNALFDADNAEALRTNILTLAKETGSFAGFEYFEEAFLDSDDDDFMETDDGLSWVAFTDLWNALEKTAKEYVTEESVEG